MQKPNQSERAFPAPKAPRKAPEPAQKASGEPRVAPSAEANWRRPNAAPTRRPGHGTAKMYAGYNQYELKGVRIGNWVDEAALLEATGHNRGPRPGEPDFGIDNPERVIGAPGATHPKDWQSDYQAGYIDHTGRDNYRPMPDHGQRERSRATTGSQPRRPPPPAQPGR